MPSRDLVVVGASAGGVEALKALVATLRADFPATIVVVIHLPASADSVLPAILARNGALPAERAVDGSKYERGRIYVAPPDRHVLIVGDRLRVTRGPRVNSHRPAIDPLFRSAARQRGPRVIGLVLSGVLDDGTAGAVAIKNAGGAVVVQAPDDALYPAMPRSVLEHVAVDASVPVVEMAKVLLLLLAQKVPQVEDPMPTAKDSLDLEERNEEETAGPPSMFTCPECHGALWELDDGGALRYRCHVGHSYSPESWFAGQSDGLEDALWAAYRALRESAMFANRLAERARKQGLLNVVAAYEERRDDALERAELIHRTLEKGQVAAAGHGQGDA